MVDKFKKTIQKNDLVLFASVSNLLLGKVLEFSKNVDEEEVVIINVLHDTFVGEETVEEEVEKYPEKLIVIDKSMLDARFQTLIQKVLK